MNIPFTRRRSNCFVVALLLVMLLAACGSTPASSPSSSDSSGTITIWHNWAGASLQAKQAIFNAYMKLHPGVKILLVHQDDVVTKSTTAVKAGNGPDIIAYTDDNLGKLALSGVVIPLDQYFSKDFITQTYSSAAAQAVIFDNHVYGVPESLQAVTLMYNKALVIAEQLPKTTAALLTFERDYEKAHPGSYGVVWPTTDPYTDAAWFYGFGAQYVTPAGQAGLDTPAALAAMQYIASFKPYLPKQESYEVADALFTEGKAAAIINGPWSYANYANAKIQVGFVTLPSVTPTSTPAQPFVGVTSLWVAKTAKNPALSVDLMKFYTDKENQIAMARADGEIPANLAAGNDPAVAALPAVAGYAAQAKLGVALPNTPDLSAIWAPLEKALVAVWNGSQAPQAALQDAQTAATKGIQQINS